ncbi:50S ribosomal protein L29 [Vulgatibacter incomptus]|uniref:Large ribosomal subunit protein uL29 n=1 Tax=Vulgatibacter incomptus TaxID=1391653 RepID=A0A0K1PDT7_9BACT|nr:50S ribosomal protein L29 [Vulgatibacter incomptus]AKU91581.1 hypothetical protein AKJ08_1968 [Vulgatibacter incomptus]
MNISELRALAAADLKAKSVELRASLFDLKMRLKTGRLDSTASLQEAKRELARVLTILREQELGIRREPAAGK